jgi:hypothetical protein
VILDESSEELDLLLKWLFHRADFVIDNGLVFINTSTDVCIENVEILLKMYDKYDIPMLAKDICVTPGPIQL